MPKSEGCDPGCAVDNIAGQSSESAYAVPPCQAGTLWVKQNAHREDSLTSKKISSKIEMKYRFCICEFWGIYPNFGGFIQIDVDLLLCSCVGVSQRQRGGVLK